MDLSYNNISIDKLFSFGNHSKLSWLEFDGNRGSESSNSTISVNNFYPNLKSLYLGDLQAKNISSKNWKQLLPKLTNLYLSENEGLNVQSLFQDFPPTIEYLEMDRCYFRYLNVSELHSLQFLNLKFNSFGSLRLTDRLDTCQSEPQICVGPMNNLENLHLEFNEISALTVQFFTKNALPNLKYLYLSHNRLKTVNIVPFANSTIPQLWSMKKLDVVGNHFGSMEVACSFPNLKYLLASEMKGDAEVFFDTNLTHRCLDNLRTFEFSRNKLQEIPKDFLKKMYHLEMFDVSENYLTNFSLVSDGSVLKILQLTYNVIKCDADCSDRIKLNDFKQLKCLKVYGNDIGPAGLEYLQPLINVTSDNDSCCIEDDNDYEALGLTCTV